MDRLFYFLLGFLLGMMVLFIYCSLVISKEEEILLEKDK